MPLLLVGGSVLLPDGSTVRADVHVEGGVVVEVSSALGDGRGKEIDCTGRTVMPGLIDVHAHACLAGTEAFDSAPLTVTTRAVRNARELLATGVTTARDVGGFDGVMPEIARAIERGWLDGPDLLVANEILCATGGHGSEFGLGDECDGADAFRRGVRRQVKAGARVIKVAINGVSGVEVTEAELAAVVEESHSRGRRIACHASTAEAVELAVRCGVDTVEHGNGLTRAHAEAMAAGGVTLVPTASIFDLMRERFDQGGRDGLPDALVDLLDAALDERLEAHRVSLPYAREAGVHVATGTDAITGMPAARVVDEMQALLRYGWAVPDVLWAATGAAAAALGLEDRGLVCPGARADLLVVDGDPTQDLGSVRRPLWVIRAGRLVTLPADASDADRG